MDWQQGALARGGEFCCRQHSYRLMTSAFLSARSMMEERNSRVAMQELMQEVVVEGGIQCYRVWTFALSFLAPTSLAHPLPTRQQAIQANRSVDSTWYEQQHTSGG
jgi:hypothetical protein